MEEKKFTIDCWAFFGKVDWSIESAYEYIASVKKYMSYLAQRRHIMDLVKFRMEL